ncbi:MAG: DUF99 family protein [Methanomicrobiales archaeon]|nr:DUF99 family protein [Methanomicrobiales archaeon]
MHLQKKGLRALGIAESYSGRTMSALAGVVMRKDLRIDGFTSGTVTVGGTDATEVIIRMYRELNRKDINVILLSGCVIAWFNIIDPEQITLETKIPVICVTYEESDGLLDDIRYHFPKDEPRLAAYQNLGTRTAVTLMTGLTLYIRTAGISTEEAARFCNQFTLDGKIPEPLRVARLVARQVLLRS